MGRGEGGRIKEQRRKRGEREEALGEAGGVTVPMVVTGEPEEGEMVGKEGATSGEEGGKRPQSRRSLVARVVG